MIVSDWNYEKDALYIQIHDLEKEVVVLKKQRNLLLRENQKLKEDIQVRENFLAMSKIDMNDLKARILHYKTLYEDNLVSIKELNDVHSKICNICEHLQTFPQDLRLGDYNVYDKWKEGLVEVLNPEKEGEKKC